MSSYNDGRTLYLITIDKLNCQILFHVRAYSYSETQNLAMNLIERFGGSNCSVKAT